MKRLAWFIAKRESVGSATAPNVMVRIATAAVAVSIAVVIISLSVIFGFKEEISSIVSGMASDITISSPYAKRQPEQHPFRENDSLRNIIASTDGVSRIERFALRNCIVRGKEGAVGVVLKGIDQEGDISIFTSRLESGEPLKIEERRGKSILLSKSVASQIGATVDSRVEILIIEDETPRRELFKVCGVYNSALGEDGSALALTDIRNVQKINGWESDQITGYACRLNDPTLAEQRAAEINYHLLYEYNGEEDIIAISAQEEYANIFGWLETHDINAAVILTIMLIVAIFNVVTALLILVLERTRMVGTLKSLGMPNKMIRRIFTHQASRIIVRGLIIGNIIGVTLLLLQKYLHLVKLDESGYFLSEVPVDFGAGWIIATNLLFAVIIIAITYLSSSIVGRIKVAEAIKYS
jgi:lipoprotein-releasing system permease protein